MNVFGIGVLLFVGAFAAVALKARADLVARRARPSARNEGEAATDPIEFLLGSPSILGIALLAAGLALVLFPFDAPQTRASLAGTIPAALVLAATWIARDALAHFSRGLPRTSPFRRPAARAGANAAIFAVGGTLFLETIGVPALGLLWVAIALVALAAILGRTTLLDLASGAILAVDAPFSVGDYVRVAGAGEGQVREVGWSRTSLRRLDGAIVAVPNRLLLAEPVVNYGAEGEGTRAEIRVLLASDVAPDRALKSLQQAVRDGLAESPELTAPGEPQVLFESASGRASAARVLFQARDRAAVAPLRHVVLTAVHRRLKADRIDLAASAETANEDRPEPTATHAPRSKDLYF